MKSSWIKGGPKDSDPPQKRREGRGHPGTERGPHAERQPRDALQAEGPDLPAPSGSWRQPGAAAPLNPLEKATHQGLDC